MRSWIEEEGSSGAAERLKQLCAAGGKLESAALRLAHALTPPPPTPRVLISRLHSFAIEALLVLLLRARQTSECITQVRKSYSSVFFYKVYSSYLHFRFTDKSFGNKRSDRNHSKVSETEQKPWSHMEKCT